MFSNPPLYSNIIEDLNNHHLPTDERRFANLLKEDYGVTESASERAARIFLENARRLNLLDSHNILRFSFYNSSESDKPKEKIEAQQPQVLTSSAEPSLFRLPIPLPDKRIAYLEYPRDSLKKKDIKVIAKALAFIAVSELEENEAKEVEKFTEDQISED